MTGDDEAKTTEQLRAEVETLRRQLAARSALPESPPSAILSVPVIAATQAGPGDTPASSRPPNLSVAAEDAAPRYVPWLKSRFWEETGLDPSRYDTFVETGSYRGETLDFMKGRFGCLHSIELSRKWHEFCVARFKDCPHIHLHWGDSTELLPRILHRIDRPVIVFLDAHYSGGSTARPEVGRDSPLLVELACLQSRPVDDIIIIDDTAFFDAKGGNEPEARDDDQVWPPFAYDWTGITRERVLALMKPGYGLLENTHSRYTLTPREDQLILYPAGRAVRGPG